MHEPHAIIQRFVLGLDARHTTLKTRKPRGKASFRFGDGSLHITASFGLYLFHRCMGNRRVDASRDECIMQRMLGLSGSRAQSQAHCYANCGPRHDFFSLAGKMVSVNFLP